MKIAKLFWVALFSVAVAACGGGGSGGGSTATAISTTTISATTIASMPYNGSVAGANNGYYLYTTVGTVSTISVSALTSDIDPKVYTDATFTTLNSNWTCTTNSGAVADSCTATTPVPAGTALFIKASNYAGTSSSFTLTTGAASGLTAGYVVQGGLTWMPVSGTTYDYAGATALCAGTINGQTGWRLPTEPELNALYTSGAMNGQGWTLGYTWSSTVYSAGSHYYVDVSGGFFSWVNDTHFNYVSCVRSSGTATTISATATTTAQSLTVGTAMTSFSPLTASGGTTPYAYSYTGTLPTGLSFSTSTGAVTGTPTAAYATANLVFSVRDANNNYANTTSTVSFTATVPAAYVVQGGLTWMPVSTTRYSHIEALGLCEGTINGQTGWRLPTEPELSALYTSGAMNGQGWSLSGTWSFTFYKALSGYNTFYLVNLYNGHVGWDNVLGTYYVSCVR